MHDSSRHDSGRVFVNPRPALSDGLILVLGLAVLLNSMRRRKYWPDGSYTVSTFESFSRPLSTPTMFAMTGTLAGPRAAGRWAGAQNVFGQLAGIIAPIVTGLIVDRTGAFSWAFAVAAASAILAVVAWGIVITRVETVAWPAELTPASTA
jgi:MFS family permease